MGWPNAKYLSNLRRRIMPMLGIGVVLGLGAVYVVRGEIGATVNAQEAPQAPAQITQGNRIIIPPGSPLRRELRLGIVEGRQTVRSLTLPAVVEANPALVAKVVPPVPGRITELRVAAGDHVQKGQVVAVIETADPADTPGPAAQTQKSRLMELRAPATGTVSDLALARGAFFDVPIQPLMTVARYDTVWVTASVPEENISFVSKGQSIDVRLLAYPGQVFHGRIFFTSDVLDPDTRRMKVRVALPNLDGKLKPGMFANATFLARPETVATLPATALVLKNDADAVLVEVAPWTFEARPIETQAQQGDQILIAKGVTPGQRVVVSGGVLLND